MQCPNCEAENRDGAKFCNECGFPLSGAIARVAGAASPKGPSAKEPQPQHEEPPKSKRAEEDPVKIQPAQPLVYDDGRDDEREAAARPSSYGSSQYPDSFEPVAPQPSYRVEPAAPKPPYRRAPIAQEPPYRSAPSTPNPPFRYGQYAQEPPFRRDPVVQDTPFEPEPFDDMPMAEDVYDPGSWMYEQMPTQSFPAQQDDAFGYGEDAHGAGGYEAVQNEWPGEFTMEMPPVERDRKPRARDFRVEAKRSDKGRAKLAVFIVAGVLVGAIVALIVTFALGMWGGVEVPDVTGMTEADARDALVDEGFSVRTTQVKSDDTEGIVLIMDPGAGARAPEGSEVVIHIATARFIPDIVGKNADEAKALIEEAGYENVRYEMQKSDDEENIVLEVSPNEGTRAKSSAEVVVKVSEAYRVPNVEGLNAEEAADAVSDAGLTPEITYIDTDQFPDGSIIGTNPEAGTKVSKGDTVSISVARVRGVELVGLTEEMFSQGNTVTIGGVDYEIESVISVSYQGDDTVAFTANGRPKITFFGETLYASSSQTISGQVVWSEDNEVISIT